MVTIVGGLNWDDMQFVTILQGVTTLYDCLPSRIMTNPPYRALDPALRFCLLALGIGIEGHNVPKTSPSIDPLDLG